MPNVEIGDLLNRLNRLRDRARASGRDDIYIDLIEACALCEALANPDGDWNKTVDVRDVAAQLRRRGLHLLPRIGKENPKSLDSLRGADSLGDHPQPANGDHLKSGQRIR